MSKSDSGKPDRDCHRKEPILLVILACGATVEQAAKQTGFSERTIYRRLAQPEFQRRLQQVRADMLQRTSGTLTATGAEAVRTLVTLLNPTIPANVRLGAARAVLEVAIKVREAADIEKRLLDLETQVAALNPGPKLRLVPDDRELTDLPETPAAGPATVPNEAAS